MDNFNVIRILAYFSQGSNTVHDQDTDQHELDTSLQILYTLTVKEADITKMLLKLLVKEYEYTNSKSIDNMLLNPKGLEAFKFKYTKEFKNYNPKIHTSIPNFLEVWINGEEINLDDYVQN